MLIPGQVRCKGRSLSPFVEISTARWNYVFDSRDELEKARKSQFFGESILKCDPIPSFAIREKEIILDVPHSWDQSLPLLVLHRDHDKWKASGSDYSYEAARTDTPTLVLFTGTWTQDNFGSGPFIVALPIGG